jgi:hypothetical protein
MPRLPALEYEDAPEEARPFYDADVHRYGVVLNNTKLYAHNVAVLAAIKEFSARFAEAAALPIDLKALVRVRVASLTGCPF